MKETLTHYQEPINTHITQKLSQARLQEAGAWGHEVQQRLARFCTQGKGVRASLVCAAYNFFETDLPEHVLKTAAGLELIHAGLLIHDDIMDEDDTRRNMPSSHMHYAQLNTHHPNPKHTGQSLAICEADIAYFLGLSMLDSRIIHRAARIFALVGVAQMTDVTNEYAPIHTDDILTCYTNKTARYSIGLPLWIGAMLANQEDLADALYEIGVHAGIVYQLRDDELGLFGKPEITGKPQGSDLRQGKQTIYIALLKERMDKEAYTQLQETLKNPSEEDIAHIQELITQSGARNAAKDIHRVHEEQARALIEQINLSAQHKTFLKEVLAYCGERQK